MIKQFLHSITGTALVTATAGMLFFSSCSKDNPLTSNPPLSLYSIYFPFDVAVDTAGTMYITNGADYDIEKATSKDDLSVYAGTDTMKGFSGDGGQARSAKLGVVTGICIDKHNNIYFTDDNRVRMVTAATTIINTVAGNGTAGYSGDGGQATAAAINDAGAVALDTAGNLYITDYYSNRVRVVNKATGIITTVAGTGGQGYSGDGGQATAAQLYYPEGIVVDDSGDMYIGDKVNNVIRKVKASTGIISTYAGNGTQTYTGDGGAATATGMAPSASLALDTARNLYIADPRNSRVYVVNAKTGIITTVAGNGKIGNSGNGGPATNAALSSPTGVFVDKAGNIYVVDQNADCVRKVNGVTHIITQAAYN